MKKAEAKSRRTEGQVRVGLGYLRLRMKLRCARYGITMHEGIIQACELWLKEGRKKAA